MTALGLGLAAGGILIMWAGVTGQPIAASLRSILTGQPIGPAPVKLTPAQEAAAAGKGGASSSGGGAGGGGGGVGAS